MNYSNMGARVALLFVGRDSNVFVILRVTLFSNGDKDCARKKRE